MESRSSPTPQTRFGLWAETQVATYLTKRGYLILDRNFRRPWGELDLIAQWQKTLVFVEVKASQRPMRGFVPHDRANQIKLRKVVRTALTWLVQRGISPESSWRVDVVALTLAPDRRQISIQHFKNVTVG